jgi:MFS family permease
LFYVYSTEVLKVDGTIYALTYSMQGIGSVLAGFFIAPLSRRISVHWLIGSAMALMGTLEMSYLLIPSIPLMLVSCLLIGILQQIAMVVSNTVYQANCDRKVMGKVLGFRQMVTNLMMIATTGVAIYLQDLVGLQPVLVGSACLMFVSGLCGYLFVRDEKSQSVQNS